MTRAPPETSSPQVPNPNSPAGKAAKSTDPYARRGSVSDMFTASGSEEGPVQLLDLMELFGPAVEQHIKVRRYLCLL